MGLSQYAFGLTERGFDLRVQENNIATVIGDGSDFSGMYPGRPIMVYSMAGAMLRWAGCLGQRYQADRTSISVRIDTDSYVAEELIFVPAALTIATWRPANAYAITIPPAVGGRCSDHLRP